MRPLEKLPLYVSAGAAVIVLVACIISEATLYWMAAWVSLAIVLFYFIGHALRLFLLSYVFVSVEIPIDEMEAYDESDEDKLAVDVGTVGLPGREYSDDHGMEDNGMEDNGMDSGYEEDDDDYSGLNGFDEGNGFDEDNGYEEGYEGDQKAESAPVGDAFLDRE